MAEETLYLAHHGIRGQKWGRRRWQNADGSLTPAGREHYGKGFAGRSKQRAEDKLLRKALNADTARKRAKRIGDEWADEDFNKSEKIHNKYDKLSDKEDRLVSAARGYEEGKRDIPNWSKDTAQKLWSDAAKAGNEAEDYWDKVVKPHDDKVSRLWNETKQADEDYKKLDADLQKASKKYIDKYGSVEYDKLPKTSDELVSKTIDDMLDVLSGNMTKDQYNRRYKGTGFRMS